MSRKLKLALFICALGGSVALAMEPSSNAGAQSQRGWSKQEKEKLIGQLQVKFHQFDDQTMRELGYQGVIDEIVNGKLHIRTRNFIPAERQIDCLKFIAQMTWLKDVVLDFVARGPSFQPIKEEETPLPDEFSKLVNLESLSLRVNKLKELPGWISNFQNLRFLSLSGTQLEKVSPEIGKLGQLEILFLSRNKLESLPREIGDLKNLKELDLGGNNLESLPYEINNVQSLLKLDLRKNKFQEFPEEITDLENLTGLYFSENQLHSISPNIGKLVNLKILALSDNPLQSLPHGIMSLSNLIGLQLAGTLPSLTQFPDGFDAFLADRIKNGMSYGQPTVESFKELIRQGR